MEMNKKNKATIHSDGLEDEVTPRVSYSVVQCGALFGAVTSNP